MTGLGRVVSTFACGWKFFLVRSFECDFSSFPFVLRYSDYRQFQWLYFEQWLSIVARNLKSSPPKGSFSKVLEICFYARFWLEIRPESPFGM